MRLFLLQTNFSRCYWVYSTRCNHLENWKISISIFFWTNSHLKNMFFTWFFPRKRPILCEEYGFSHTENDTECVISTCTLKMWRYFFFNFFLKNSRLWKNDNCKLSFVQTLSKLFSLFCFYDARLFIKMYIQGFARALITNLLSDLQISEWWIEYGE